MPAASTLGLERRSDPSIPPLDEALAHAALHASLPAPIAALHAADDALTVADREVVSSSPSMVMAPGRDTTILGAKPPPPGRASAAPPASAPKSRAADIGGEMRESSYKIG